MEEARIRVEKFDGKDFGFWKMQIEDFLYQKDLHQPLFGLDKKPVTMTNDTWSLLDRKALGAVRMTLSKSIVFNVKEEKTTHSLMAALSKMYEQPSAANKVHLMKSLFKMEMSEGDRFSQHLNEFNSVTSQLSSVKIDFEDEVKALLILSQLPESWNGMVTAVSNSCGKEKLKLDDVVSLILTEEVKRISSSETSTSGSALNFQDRGRFSDRDSGRSRDGLKSRPNVVCWNCDQEGHYKSDCPAPKKKGGRRSQANVAVDTDAEVIQDALVLSVDNDGGESWVLDSGAFRHATANKEVMSSYEQGRFGKAHVGDGRPCDIVGMGNVDVNTRGSTWKLKDVRHIPGLRKNLVSVGQICDEVGGEVTFSSTSWRVKKGAMVLARGPRNGNLYTFSQVGQEGKEGKLVKSLCGREAPRQGYAKVDRAVNRSGCMKKAYANLGVNVSGDGINGVLKSSKTDCVERIVHLKLNMESAKPMGTLLASRLKLANEMSPKKNEEEGFTTKGACVLVVDSPVYATEIARAVGAVSKFMESPVGEHPWDAVKCTCRYPKSTSGLPCVYGCNSVGLRGLVDSDCHGGNDSESGTTGKTKAFVIERSKRCNASTGLQA